MADQKIRQAAEATNRALAIKRNPVYPHNFVETALVIDGSRDPILIIWS
jgi:hypothetical protein